MNKKPYNQIEEQMKAAARDWEPAFDEQAWQHMEQMLEKEDNRKRPFAWWLLLIPVLMGIATAGYFGIYKKSADKNIASITHETHANSAEQKPDQKNRDTPNNDAEKQKETITTAGNEPISSVQNVSPVPLKSEVVIISAQNDQKIFPKRKNKKSAAGRIAVNISPAVAVAEDEQPLTIIKDDDLINDTDKSNPVPLVDDKIKSDEDIMKSKPIVTKENKADEKSDNKTTGVQAKKPLSEKDKNRQSKFYFSVFGGMEGNGVDFPGINKFSARVGFTSGYYLNSKLSVQAGIFAGSKKYVAGKEDYKAKPGSYWSTVDIKKVDANCRVFEIPVSVRYDFKPGKRYNSFAGVGLSSFIMDKEDYRYEYIYYNIPYQGNASYKGNQHWFSVLRLYAGLERKLSGSFSLGIQPGLAIPLAGVGEGQIKLFSSELLLHVKYQPFKKSRSNQ